MIAMVAIHAGCATRNVEIVDPSQVLDLGSGHVEVDPHGELPPRFWDSYTLLAEGNALFDQEKYAEAITYFRAVAQRFTGEQVAGLALFNLGACYEKLEEYEPALRAYESLENIGGPKISSEEILVRQLSCLEELGRWDRAITITGRLLAESELPETDRIDVSLRRGIAFYKNENSESGKAILKKALMDFRILERRQLPINKYFAAKGYFYLGEIYFDQYEAIALDADDDELRLQLEAKADFLYLARTQYLRSMRTYEGQWLAASLHKLGYGYETMYFSMKNAPLPEDLSSDEIVEYREKLEKRISNLLNKAVDAYERNIDLDRRFEIKSPWARQSVERLSYLRRYREEMKN